MPRAGLVDVDACGILAAYSGHITNIHRAIGYVIIGLEKNKLMYLYIIVIYHEKPCFLRVKWMLMFTRMSLALVSFCFVLYQKYSRASGS